MDNLHDISAEAVALIRQPLREQIAALEAERDAAEARGRRDALLEVKSAVDAEIAVTSGGECEPLMRLREVLRAALAASAPAPVGDGWKETAKELPAHGCGPILMRDRDDPNSFCIVIYEAGRWEYWSSGDPLDAEDVYSLWMLIPPLPPAPRDESREKVPDADGD